MLIPGSITQSPELAGQDVTFDSSGSFTSSRSDVGPQQRIREHATLRAQQRSPTRLSRAELFAVVLGPVALCHDAGLPTVAPVDETAVARR